VLLVGVRLGGVVTATA